MSECKKNSKLVEQAEENAACLIKKLKDFSCKLCLAESCTAGLISSLLAAVPGASGVLWGSYVCYTQEAKMRMLDLNEEEIKVHGLVSKETACSMALGALKKSEANSSSNGVCFAASVTGLAGPDGDGSSVPVGTVWAAVASKGGITAKEFHFTGSRNEVRLLAAISVMEMLQEQLTKL